MIKIGVIGAGNIANTFCEAVNKSVEGASLEAVASRNLDKANQYKEKYKFKKAYGSYDELYQDPDIDLIYIAIPHAFHYNEMMNALDHNKHILCEKPFTLNAKLAKKVFAKAKEKNVFIMEAMWTRFLPVIQAVQKEIANGVIGKVNHLEADFCFKPNESIDHRLYQPKLGGGALLDVGIYPITFANLFMGIPDSFTSEVKMSETKVDISEIITYNYSFGKAILKAALDYELPLLARLHGEKGSIIIEGLHETESAKIFDENSKLIKHIHIPHNANGFEYEVRNVIKNIKASKTESEVMPHNETINILTQMDSIRKSWNFYYPQER